MTRNIHHPCFIGALSAMVLLAGGINVAANENAVLSKYVGKYPSDKVDGISFTKNEAVTAAVKAALAHIPRASDLEHLMLAPENAIDSAIALLSSDRLYARSFDPSSGGSINWAILITGDGTKAAICYSEEAIYGSGVSRWYYKGDEAFTLEGPCPSEVAEIESAIGTWPVGALPKS